MSYVSIFLEKMATFCRGYFFGAPGIDLRDQKQGHRSWGLGGLGAPEDI